MASVQCQVVGGEIKQEQVGTVGDLKRKLSLQSYQATVNGNAASDDRVLKDYEFVTLSPSVKGA